MRSLSGGMKRRVLVGQALVHKPPVIVLDEPTAGVDVELRQSLWAFIRKLNRDGHTIILTTHYLEEAEALCGRIAMLKAGTRRRARHQAGLLSRFAGLTVRLVGADSARRRGTTGCCARTGDVLSPRPRVDYAELERAARGAARGEGIADRRSSTLDEADLEQVFLRIMQSGTRRRRRGRGVRVKVAAMTPWSSRASGGGAWTLLRKELLRFWKVSFQTIAAPVLTALLYLLIFSHVLESHVAVFDGRSRYTAFLVPGLVMMSVLQNAFANSSSSLIQSKITGNLDLRAAAAAVAARASSPPTSLGAMVRGLVVGLGVFVGDAAGSRRGLVDARASAVGDRVRAARQRDPRHARPDRRHLGRQVRPARGVPELHHHAAHVPVGRVLLDPLAAAVLAGAVALQSVLLHDRRLPLRLLRPRPTWRPTTSLAVVGAFALALLAR